MGSISMARHRAEELRARRVTQQLINSIQACLGAISWSIRRNYAAFFGSRLYEHENGSVGFHTNRGDNCMIPVWPPGRARTLSQHAYLIAACMLHCGAFYLCIFADFPVDRQIYDILKVKLCVIGFAALRCAHALMHHRQGS